MTPASNSLPELLQFLRASTIHSAALLQRLWAARDAETWSTSSEIYTEIGEAMLSVGEPLLAYDAISEGVKCFPSDTRLRQLLALALARSGAAGPANRLLLDLYAEGHQDEETLGLLARTHKDLWVEATHSEQ